MSSKKQGKRKKPAVLIANHSSDPLPEVRGRLRHRGFRVLISHNLIDTISLLNNENPQILALKPSAVPVPDFEINSIQDASEINLHRLLILTNEAQLKKISFNHWGLDDFYIGESATELAARISLVISRKEHEAGIGTRLKALEEQSITDYKTGLYNDRYIFRRLLEEFQRADRHHMTLSIIMMDLDGFKTLNDTQGHPFGDFVLQAFAKQLISLIRNIDIPGRYGGDEFLILLPNTGLDEAAQIGSRIRTFLESHTFEKGGQRVRLTISQGINTYSGDGRCDCDALLKGADQAVLEAKKRGKNRVCLYPLMEQEDDYGIKERERVRDIEGER
ncbi:MAG: GGDEF domain-containing protein [Planctomycetes bacterium]|nr:GGDEF domain-containing protein [Planctomycetota bacterium]